ncbi:MAG: hypothetical protein PVI86_16715, partial [Phycisphaerae bacterium]
MRKGTTLLALVVMGAWATSALAAVDFHLAGTNQINGFGKATVAGVTLHVSPDVAVTGQSIKSADAIDSSSGTDIEVVVGPAAAQRLADSMKKNGANRLVAVSSGRIIGAGTPTVDTKSGRITIAGMNANIARRLTRVLNGASVTQLGPAVELVPSTTSLTAGGVFTVDVFAANIPDLRVYQATLDAVGGTRGNLTVSDLKIDGTRSNFVFAGQKKIDAVDRIGGRLGAMLFDGSVDVANRAYLGSFTLKASNDAAG